MIERIDGITKRFGDLSKLYFMRKCEELTEVVNVEIGRKLNLKSSLLNKVKAESPDSLNVMVKKLMQFLKNHLYSILIAFERNEMVQLDRLLGQLASTAWDNWSEYNKIVKKPEMVSSKPIVHTTSKYNMDRVRTVLECQKGDVILVQVPSSNVPGRASRQPLEMTLEYRKSLSEQNDFEF